MGEAFASKADVTAAQRERYTILDSDDVEDPSQYCPQLQQYWVHKNIHTYGSLSNHSLPV